MLPTRAVTSRGSVVSVPLLSLLSPATIDGEAGSSSGEEPWAEAASARVRALMRPRPRAGALLAGWQDEEVIDLSFGGATAHPVQLLNKDDVAEAVFQDGAEFTGGELFGSQSTPSAPSLPARDGEDVVQDLFTSSRPLVTSTLERRLSCAMRAEDVPRKDDTYFSFDRMLPFASAENNARTAAHFPDFVNPSDPRSPWELPGARAAAASVVRRAFAMAGLPAPPTA